MSKLFDDLISLIESRCFTLASRSRLSVLISAARTLSYKRRDIFRKAIKRNFNSLYYQCVFLGLLNTGYNPKCTVWQPWGRNFAV